MIATNRTIHPEHPEIQDASLNREYRAKDKKYAKTIIDREDYAHDELREINGESDPHSRCAFVTPVDTIRKFALVNNAWRIR
jgi:hypothetical protein